MSSKKSEHRWGIHNADCVDFMAEKLPDASIDSIVCDPPYGLEFMGRKWDKIGGDAGMVKPGIGERDIPWPAFGGDPLGGANPTCATCKGRKRGKKQCVCDAPDWRVKGKRIATRASSGAGQQAWHARWLTEAYRVLKPGGHLVAFGGTRTYHRLVCAAEDAGFEIRDSLHWMYGSGFPKSLNVSLTMDKNARGAPQGGYDPNKRGVGVLPDRVALGQGGATGKSPSGITGKVKAYQPVTPEAQQWEGWGTALKPAHEPIMLARKPLIGTVAANVLLHGTGALHIDACRVGTGGDKITGGCAGKRALHEGGIKKRAPVDQTRGRWPPNILLTHSAACGEACAPDCPVAALGKPARFYPSLSWDPAYDAPFLYNAKAAKKEREACRPADFDGKRWNAHPTVKPVAVMRWLVKLVTPPGGVMLDPFAGSGTAGIAAVQEGVTYIGIEKDHGYCQIARRRVTHAQE